MDKLLEASLEELPKFAGALLLLLLAWFVGQRLTLRWNLRQKQRELDLNSAREFFALYGEFFATWKLWNYVIRDIGADALPGASRWDLLKRAADAEGRLEALLVNISCERALEHPEVEHLGRFRQLYQCLREAIRDGKPLGWDRITHPHYVAFKDLAPRIAALIIGDMNSQQTSEYAANNLRDITSGRWPPPPLATQPVRQELYPVAK